MGDRERERNRVEDGSQDRAYFVLVPHLVLAACEDPHQLALWTVIKMIAGEDGQCTISTADLAALAMMSTGRCHQAREALLQRGLIEGRLYRDEGYSRPVWHLRIPDLWPANIDWRERHHSLRKRIALKRAQRRGAPGLPGTEEEEQDTPDGGEAPGRRACSWEPGPPAQDGRPRSPNEGQPSPGRGQRSADERQRSQGEHQRSPGEPKKILKEEPQEEPRGEPQGGKDPAPEKIWRCALAELKMQMTQATFARWVQSLELVELERQASGTLAALVWCPDEYVRAWCAERLDVRFRQTLSGVAGEEVEVVYVVDET